MKTTFTTPALFGGIGFAIVTLFSSCVDPYYSQNRGPSHHVTDYRTGYEVRTLPSGYRTEVIDGTQYYSHNGTYYRSRSGRYTVVEPPHRYNRSPRYQEEVVVRQLPRGYRVVNHHGVRYYKVHDTYYQQRGSGYVQVHLSL